MIKRHTWALHVSRYIMLYLARGLQLNFFSAYVIASKAITSTVAPDRIAHPVPPGSIIVSTIPPPREQQLHLLRFCSLFVGGAIALFPSISVTSSTQPRDPIDTRPHHQIVSSSTLNLPRLDILIGVDGEYNRHRSSWCNYIFCIIKKKCTNIFL